MKQQNIWKLLFVLLSTWIIVACSTDSSDKTENKVDGFYFSFDELEPNGGVYSGRITDYSGSNFHGYTDSIAGVPGKIGSAAAFWVAPKASILLEEISDYFPFETGFTFRAWIKPIFSGHQQIIGSTVNRLQGSNGDGFGLAIGGSQIIFELPETPDFEFFRSPLLNFPIDDWYHIAVSYDGENLSYYFNGDLVGTDTVITSFEPQFFNHIGNIPNANSDGYPRQQFLSNIDELYLENRVMSSHEIMSYYLETM